MENSCGYPQHKCFDDPLRPRYLCNRNGHLEIGRDGEIRTRDPLHPMQVRYQAAPRPDRKRAC